MIGSVYLGAVASALPSHVSSNEELLAKMPWLDVSPDWVREHTGIRNRHLARPDEHSTDLGLRAACAALERAEVAAEDTDLILLATNTSQFVYPSGAAIVQAGLAKHGYHMPRAAALDLQQGCAGFVAGITLAKGMVQSGTCRQVLVVGADVGSRMVDWTDRSSLLLGDGAAACIVASHRPSGDQAGANLELLGSFMRTMPDLDSICQRGVLDVRNHPMEHAEFAATQSGRVTKELLYSRLQKPVPGEDHHFHMDGRKVYRFVRRTVPGSGFHEVLHAAGIVSGEELADLATSSPSSSGNVELRADIGKRVDRFVPHGANMVLNQELADQMHIPYSRMALTLQDHGNTSAASVGIALERLMRSSLRYETVAKRDGEGHLTKASEEVIVEQLRPGNNVLLLSFGAGTSWNYIAARAN